VPGQLLGQRGPGAAEDLAPPGRAERRARRRVGGQPGHRGGERPRIRRRHQVSGHLVLYQVERSSVRRGDHRQAARRRLLQRLAERLVRAAVHEHVEAGVDGRECLAPALAEEDGARQLLAQRGLGRPGADDDQPDPVQRGDPGEQVDSLLGGQAPHVPGDQLTSRRHLGPDLRVALGRVEALRVHAASP
jgi:hypothetical protein